MVRKLIRQLGLLVFVGLLGLAIKFLPNDADKTRMWLMKLPLEE